MHDVLLLLAGSRKLILRTTIAVALVTAIVNYFVLPLRFSATASLLPEGSDDRLSAFGDVAGIAELAGLNISSPDVVRLYPAVAMSETVLRRVIERSYSLPGHADRGTLYVYYELTDLLPAEALDGALRELRQNIGVTFDTKTNIVTLALTAGDPALAADILNGLLEELDGFMREERVTKASGRRTWIETRLAEVEERMKKAEASLQHFRETNRRIADSPSLVMRDRALSREVEMNVALFIELKKQYEIARIEEIRNTPVVSVLDHARPPVKKSGPNRSGNTLIMAFLAAAFSGGYVVLKSLYADRISRILGSLKRAGPTVEQ